ncbi:MAG: hypothetical protein LC725_03010 [Lentisphaerae bacterium]|nr:hypothetical protein [Lentisphaerota bacterium]
MRNSQWDMPGKALAAIHGAKELPDVIPAQFMIQSSQVPGSGSDAYTFQLPVSYIRKAGAEPINLYLDSRGRRKEIYQYDIRQIDGTGNLIGDWQPPFKVTIPADQPAGIYAVHLGGTVVPDAGGDIALLKRRSGFIFFPLTGPGVPEVLTFPRDAKGTRVQAGGQGYWFMVPEGTQEFWIELGAGRPTSRYSVWNPQGERVFSGYPTDEVQKIDIGVDSGLDGKLWRVTGGNCTIDPKIPPYFAVTRSKWFDPGISAQP